MPLEPPPTSWAFPPAASADDHGVVGIGADLEPATLLGAYRSGLFPMPVDRGRGALAWWSPDPRGIIPLDQVKISRSLRQSCKKYEVRIDTAFPTVVDACRDPRREGAWITAEIAAAYLRMHELGWAHSVESWTPSGRLAGGLYGISIGGFFAGESMFHHTRDASKVALVGLVNVLRSAGAVLLDVQWTTPHLLSLGAIDTSRDEYLGQLKRAVALDVDPFDAARN